MKISDFDYKLPQNLIAQKPAKPRDYSRLMILNRQKKTIQHSYFYNLPNFLKSTDLLIFNNSKVIPARLHAQKMTSGKVEVFLLREIKKNCWEVLTKPSLRYGLELKILAKHSKKSLRAQVKEKLENGKAIIKFDFDLNKLLNTIGNTPLPPYIKNDNYKSSWYQTIFAKNKGSVAAPTAGLHFTNRLFKKLKQNQIECNFITLHVGLGTFLPIKTDQIKNHIMHQEVAELTKQCTNSINQAKKNGKRIIAVGSTTTRTLEYISTQNNGKLVPFQGSINNFIYPPYEFKCIGGILTNFHLPKSTLLLMISAFAGKDLIFKAYQEAINYKYRFYSFGDAMLII